MATENLNQQIRRLLNSPRFYHTASGRYALEIALQSLRLPEGSHVLCPWYICESALQPFRKLNVPVSFYKVTSDLGVCLDDLKQLLEHGPPVGAVLFVNYFGFQQNGAEVAALCRAYETPTIEDNTQSFMSVSPASGQLLGTIGDLGVFTFRKSAFLLGGAALSINRPDLSPPAGPLVSRKTASWLKLQKARLRVRMRFVLTGRNYPLRPLSSPALYKTGTLHSSRAGYELYRGQGHLLHKLILKFFDFSRERQRHQKKFERVEAHLTGQYGLTAAISTTPLKNFCPYMFPFLSRNLLDHVNQLRQEGYVAQTWPGPLPPETPDYFSQKSLFEQKELGVILLGYY